MIASKGGKWHEVAREIRTPLQKARWWHRQQWLTVYVAKCGEVIDSGLTNDGPLPDNSTACAHCRRKLGLLPQVTRLRIELARGDGRVVEAGETP